MFTSLLSKPTFKFLLLGLFYLEKPNELLMHRFFSFHCCCVFNFEIIVKRWLKPDCPGGLCFSSWPCVHFQPLRQWRDVPRASRRFPVPVSVGLGGSHLCRQWVTSHHGHLSLQQSFWCCRKTCLLTPLLTPLEIESRSYTVESLKNNVSTRKGPWIALKVLTECEFRKWSGHQDEGFEIALIIGCPF